MKIITAPHQTLRAKAKPVKKLDQKVYQFLNELETMLTNKQDPPGVGLAAPQVDQSWRVFAVRPVSQRGQENVPPVLMINPRIIDHSSNRVLGANPEEPDLEGCLSIPNIYGPVPRWSWVELEYQVIEQGVKKNSQKNTTPPNNRLAKKTKKFEDFTARIIQHELDHLDGILFTDHLLKYDLPAYISSGDELTELTNRSILEVY
ncbi:MAG: peptide deformylase [Candidatus Pacebacteria bacterium]|nr:peptide deformylase [Candidatus Paceibacterota bacterium]